MKHKVLAKTGRPSGDSGHITAACAVLLLLFTTHARAAEKQVMHGHVPAVVARLQPMGNFAGTNHLNLAIGLPLRNQAALTNLLHQIYDPASPNYHHYLTPEQFTEQFGPTEKDYQAVMAFAKASGLQVTGTHPNRLLVDVSGSVADIEKTLHVTLRVYQHPTEKRMFHAPDIEPSLNLATPILRISGLDNYSLPRPRLQATPLARASKALPNAGSGPDDTYMGNDFRAAYAPGVTLTGSGQIVGLLQYDGYTASDITYYESQAGLPSVTLSNVLIDGASGNPSGGNGAVEVSLDIEMAISMAPGLSEVVVYMAPNETGLWEDILNRMATDNLAKQLSCSWYEPGAGANPATDEIFQQMAVQGQSFFCASGDDDAYTGLIPFPEDTPYITQVGGTTLSTSGPGGAWVSETVWNRGGSGSGGGISTQYPIPSWQTNINMTANQGSTTMRNTPDVALTADNVYVRAYDQDYNVGGTSCAAPLWAGFAALVNQQAVASGKPTVGFINPAVDAIGSGVNYTSAFHDITTGNNDGFYAVSGYDLCTGWGTPVGQNLIDALANPEALVITPATGFNSIGGVGGPFTITSQSLSLTNAGTNSLTWTLVNTSLWLNASPSGGTLTHGGPATTVTVSLNTAASNLVVGTYSATLWFTNLSSGVGQSRQFTLAVISPPTITAQPLDQAVLEGAMATFTVAATGGLPLFYQWQDNGTNLTDGGNISGSTTTNLVISNVSPVDVGTYSVIVTNVAGVATSSNALLTITPSPPVITLQPADQTAVVGETAAFTVAAIGTTPFSYQWSFDGTNLVGMTDATLTLTNVQLSQAGSYAVVITNIYGSATSSNATLNVYTVPVIISFDPPSGAAGTVVNISGLNFDPTPSNNIVYFGAVQAAVTAASVTNLVVTVPVGAAYAPITETVNGLTAYANAPFMPTFSGDGSLSPSSLSGPMNLTAGSGPGRVVIADLDGDGKPDMVVADAYDGEVYIYRNISTNGTLGAASFASPVILTIGGGSDGMWGLAVVDVDGDGRLDIVVLDQNVNQVMVLRNLCVPGNITTNSFASPVSFAVGSDPRGIAVRDLDGDGKPEIVVANWGDSTVSVLQNIGAVGSITTNSFAPAVNFATGPNPQNVAIADVDGDGKPDVVSVNNNDGTSSAVSVLRNISTLGNIAFAPEVDYPGLSSSYDIAIGDLDGDGKLDLAVSSFLNGQAVSVYRNVSTPGSITTDSFAPPVDFAAGGWGNSVTIGDVDGDGKPDVAVVTQSPDHLSIFKNTSTPGSFTTSSFAARVDFSAGWNPNGVAIGDLDGDGRPDVVFGNSYNATISIYQNEVSFEGPPVIITQPTDQTATVGGTANFSVTASGTPPLSYQWNCNGTNIVGAIDTTLTLTNVQFNQAGNYAVTVTNLYGSAVSSNAVLTVTPLPPCMPPPLGIVSWWKGENSALDQVGGNNGTLVGNTTYGPGEAGQAFVFDGNGSGVAVGNPASLQLQDLTIETWIKRASTSVVSGNGPNAILFGYGSGGYLFFINESGILVFSQMGNPGYVSGPAITDANFHHVAVTKSGSGIVFYLDGLAYPAPAYSVTFTFTTSASIGCFSDGGISAFWGTMDEVSVYNRALSVTEIQAIYNADGSGKCITAIPPVIISQPTNQTVTVGGTANFSVTASGTPPLNYQWNFNGTNIVGATNTILTLTNVQFNQAGNYAVLVTNLYGSILSSNALLTVTLDHFTWSPILSPRFVNTPFAVSIQARDMANGLFTNFTGTAILSSTNGVAVTPPVSGNFVQGVWTGPVVIAQPASNLELRADDGLGHFGLANSINVLSLPGLEMLHSGNIALFMWPVSYSGFMLETSGSLSPAAWVMVPYSPIQIGDQYLLPLDMSGTNGFYRLWFPGP